MKLRKSIAGLILLFCINFYSVGQDTILLFHPTAYNLEVIQKLVNEGLFLLDGYHLLGVYHPGESYDYSEANAYIEQHNATHFSLRELNGELGPENIFRKNPATGQFRKLFECSGGALFMGGPDIPPVVYGEEVHLLTRVTDPFRHYLELSYLFHLLGGSQDPDWAPYLEENKTYLVNGICLGMQTMSVATGGTMVQDIPTELYKIWNAEEVLALPPDQMHRNYMDYLNRGCEDPTSYHFHRVALAENMILTSGIGFNNGTDPLVLSSHHQAIEKLGSGWEVAATSMDGKIIEAIQHTRYPNVLGIQFHPEKPGLFDPSIQHPGGCDSTINFQEAIGNSDSYLFHVAFWKYLAQILLQNRLASD
ncbi:MAG: gamma-glutamyl-gamma-aminobutyrate hydrolase family protein [Bacteroidales bacterium]|nr:gamma-glutamyl-gamma-aminobutyrate hydrolase family protein [Bacteroidales bacterium]